MMDILTAWATSLGATDTPALPAPWAMQAYRVLGWALVLGSLGAVLGSALRRPLRALLVLALVGWVALPGTYSPDYWLGLAFQAPSGATVLLCAWLLVRALRPGTQPSLPLPPIVWALVACGIAAGYVLLLDTFAVLPWQIYRLGFSPALLVLVTTLGLLLWVAAAATPGAALPLAVVPVAALLFAGTRLHTGNLWDALLDPLLWLVLHGMAIRAAYRLVRGRKLVRR